MRTLLRIIVLGLVTVTGAACTTTNEGLGAHDRWRADRDHGMGSTGTAAQYRAKVERDEQMAAQYNY